MEKLVLPLFHVVAVVLHTPLLALLVSVQPVTELAEVYDPGARDSNPALVQVVWALTIRMSARIINSSGIARFMV